MKYTKNILLTALTLILATPFIHADENEEAQSLAMDTFNWFVSGPYSQFFHSFLFDHCELVTELALAGDEEAIELLFSNVHDNGFKLSKCLKEAFLTALTNNQPEAALSLLDYVKHVDLMGARVKQAHIDMKLAQKLGNKNLLPEDFRSQLIIEAAEGNSTQFAKYLLEETLLFKHLNGASIEAAEKGYNEILELVLAQMRKNYPQDYSAQLSLLITFAARGNQFDTLVELLKLIEQEKEKIAFYYNDAIRKLADFDHRDTADKLVDIMDQKRIKCTVNY